MEERKPKYFIKRSNLNKMRKAIKDAVAVFSIVAMILGSAFADHCKKVDEKWDAVAGVVACEILPVQEEAFNEIIEVYLAIKNIASQIESACQNQTPKPQRLCGAKKGVPHRISRLSYPEIASIFNTSVSTLKNWLNGKWPKWIELEKRRQMTKVKAL